MYILINGKGYVMENPMKMGEYINTTSPVHAKEFSYKQARSLLKNKSKKLSWIKSFYMVDVETNQVCETSRYYNGNAGVYLGENANAHSWL